MSTATKERPILFSAPMVLAILSGAKTQTRRIIRCACNSDHLDRKLGDWGLSIPPHRWDGKSDNVPWRWRGKSRPQKGEWVEVWQTDVDDNTSGPVHCPYGDVGQHLWVRETWADAMSDARPVICYRAGLGRRDLSFDAWPIEYERYPGCKFANWASDLERGIEGRWRSPIHMPRWASRLTLEITGIRVERLQEISDADAKSEGVTTGANYAAHFRYLWSNINGPDSWGANPWVWVVSFRRITEPTT